MTPEQIIKLAEYGMGLIALFMLYSINYNHLVNIERVLIEIKGLLDPAD